MKTKRLSSLAMASLAFSACWALHARLFADSPRVVHMTNAQASRTSANSGTLSWRGGQTVLIDDHASDVLAGSDGGLLQHLWLFIAPGGGNCVATSVGPRTVITSAHCIADTAARYQLHGAQSPDVELSCRIVRPPYDNSCKTGNCPALLDVGICTMRDPTLPDLPRDKVGYETLDLEARGPELGVTAYGFKNCSTASSPQRVGSAQLRLEWPPRWDLFFVGSSVAKAPQGRYLCDGDSGAPTIVGLGPLRRVVGVVHQAGYGDVAVATFSPTEVSAFLRSAGDVCGAGGSQGCR